MNSLYRLLPHYTYNDYVQWEGHWEIIDGIPHAMSPLPSVRHQDISGNLYSLFRDALSKAKCSCKVYLPIDYKVSDDTVLQPDLLVTCKDISNQKFISEPPELVVEVLSSSTAMKDLNTKFQIYEAEKVPYYIIVEPENNELKVYKNGEDGKYHLAFTSSEGSFQFTFNKQCTIEVAFNDIW